MHISSARLSAASLATSFVLTAVAAIPSITGAQAAPPPKGAVVAHPVAVTRPAFHAATPHVTAQPHITAQPHVNVSRPVHNTPTFTQQNAHQNLHTQNPGLHAVNPNVHTNPNLHNVNPNLHGPNQNLVQQKGVLPTGQLKLGPGKPNFTPVGLKPGPGGFQQIKPKFPVMSFQNKFWPIHKGPKFIWIGGYKRFFIPVGVLGVALIGGSYWYPDGYVSLAGPSCTGFTPDGCRLHWRMVDFADGGGEPQCVQYCPQAGPPPAQFATLPPPPQLPPGGACQVTIFADPNFAGASAPSGDNQPDLAQTGWRDEISSIQVQAGTWDFFTEESFGGEQMRLQAGPYPMLQPEWTKKIGSFMCVQPGPGA